MTVETNPEISLDMELDEAAHQLGPEGPGVALLPGFFFSDIIERLHEDMQQTSLWSTPHAYFANRPNVQQEYEKIALMLSHGDQEIIDDELPSLRLLTRCVGALTMRLLRRFPDAEKHFYINDVDLHRYPPHGVLGEHQDYARNPRLIAIATIAGGGSFSTDSSTYDVAAGDLMLMRAPGLFASEYDIRPRHCFEAGDEGRLCVVLRQDETPAQTRPYDTHYDNWPDQHSL